MKFVIKVFVLICLVVISKLAKDEAVAIHKPIANDGVQSNIFTSNRQQIPLAERQILPVSTKFEKSSLQIN